MNLKKIVMCDFCDISQNNQRISGTDYFSVYHINDTIYAIWNTHIDLVHFNMCDGKLVTMKAVARVQAESIMNTTKLNITMSRSPHISYTITKS